MTVKTARVCLDCEALHEAFVCPNCGSKAWMPLEKITGTVRDGKQ